MTAPPKVSCIMPTRDRRPFVGQSIRYFLRQDYPDAELVIVDDGVDPVADLVPDDPRIRYARPDTALSIGAKRNLGCAMARGELVAHWDDDDWMAPHRLRRQVEVLLGTGAGVCGLVDLLYYGPLDGDGWLYRGGAGGTDARGAAGGRSHVAGCSIVYRRAVWAEQGFPDVNVGEDSAFVGRLAPDRVRAIDDRSLMVGLLHGGNVAPKPFGARQWQPANLDEIAALIDRDRAFYALMRNRWRSPPVRPVARRAAVAVEAPFEVHTGYGSMAEYLVLGLARAGVAVSPAPLGLAPDGLTAELLDLVRAPATPDPGAPLVFHSPLDGPDPYRHGGDVFLSTMWEADRLPAGWVRRMERARAVIVPSTFVADACRASGVTVPVAVVPQGVDPDVYHWLPRDERDGLVTLIVGPVDERKHTRLAIAAWQAAFADDPQARLVIKTTYGYHNYIPDDPRISYVDRVEPTRGIAHWYQRTDVLLALGSEGFGLPLVEGMATGLPVIALAAEGQADVCRDAAGLLLPVPPAGLEPSTEPGAAGSRSVPDAEAVVRHLRWVDEHRVEARALGAAAADWVAAHRDVWSVGPAVADVIEQTPPRRVLRPGRRVLWSPSDGTACGVAEYASRLRRACPDARLSALEPVSRAGSVVHVQHEPGILDDGRLGRFVSRAKSDGAKVVVTEHTVWPSAAPWEEQVDLRFSGTAQGAGRGRGGADHGARRRSADLRPCCGGRGPVVAGHRAGAVGPRVAAAVPGRRRARRRGRRSRLLVRRAAACLGEFGGAARAGHRGARADLADHLVRRPRTGRLPPRRPGRRPGTAARRRRPARRRRAGRPGPLRPPPVVAYRRTPCRPVELVGDRLRSGTCPAPTRFPECTSRRSPAGCTRSPG